MDRIRTAGEKLVRQDSTEHGKKYAISLREYWLMSNAIDVSAIPLDVRERDAKN